MLLFWAGLTGNKNHLAIIAFRAFVVTFMFLAQRIRMPAIIADIDKR